MTEVLLGVFWALTYIFIVIGGFRFKSENKLFMPLIAGALNFAWEIHALRISGGYWVHVVWLALDCIILYQNLYFLSTAKKRLLYSFCVVASIALIYGVCSIEDVNGMLISSFVIDFIMACEYLLAAKKLSPRYLIIIGVFRLFGDLFAWIANLRYSRFVLLVGAVVTLVNLVYVCYTIIIISSSRKKRTHLHAKRAKKK